MKKFIYLITCALFIIMDLKCTAWRQTLNCDPKGERDSLYDKDCDEIIMEGVSGYCECENGRIIMNSTCQHPAFKCKKYCESCYGFIPTKDCSPYSEAYPESYLPCSSVISSNQPGFCLCNNGKIEKRVGCFHEPFTCIDICLGSVTRRCSKLLKEPISTAQGGDCNGILRVHNTLVEGIYILLLVPPPEIEHSVGGMSSLTVQTITGLCKGAHFIFRGGEGKRLIKQYLYDGVTTDIELTDCYVPHRWFDKPYTYEYSNNNNNNVINFSLKYGEMLSKSSELKYSHPLNMEYYLFLNQSFTTINHEYEWNRTITCPYCKGTKKHSNNNNYKTCSRCGGSGEEEIKFTSFNNKSEIVINHIICSDCNGLGIISEGEYEGKCGYCNGNGYIEDVVKERIIIPSGIHGDDYKIIFKGKGEIKPFYNDQDVIFHIKYYKEKDYTREIDNKDKDNNNNNNNNNGLYNLKTTIKITMKEALNGFNKSLNTILNQTIIISKKSYTLNNEEMVLVGEGLPIPNYEDSNNNNDTSTELNQSCYNFVVTKPETNTLGCDDVFPKGIEGYCNCTYKIIPVSTLNYYEGVNCKYIGYCGNNRRGNLTIQFKVK